MQLVDQSISRVELRQLAQERYGDLVKAVVDLDRQIMVVGGELHSDAEAMLLEQGSSQQNLWGINLYPAESGEAFIEFDSMINIRPGQGNRSRSIEDHNVRVQIVALVKKLVTDV